MNKYYFYVGMDKPREIEPKEMTLEHNFLGDITEDFISDHADYKGESDYEYNNAIGLVYGVYRNPSIKMLQQVNKHYALDENDYLSDFINQEDEHDENCN